MVPGPGPGASLQPLEGRHNMDQGLVTVIGMSIAYAASFLGMALAWYAWKRRHQEEED